MRHLSGRGEARVAYSTQRDAENAEKGFDGPAGLVVDRALRARLALRAAHEGAGRARVVLGCLTPLAGCGCPSAPSPLPPSRKGRGRSYSRDCAFCGAFSGAFGLEAGDDVGDREGLVEPVHAQTEPAAAEFFNGEA